MRIKKPHKDRFHPIKVTVTETSSNVKKVLDNDIRSLMNPSRQEVSQIFEVEVLNLPLAIKEDELRRFFL
jgi:hypothetical protein